MHFTKVIWNLKSVQNNYVFKIQGFLHTTFLFFDKFQSQPQHYYVRSNYDELYYSV